MFRKTPDSICSGESLDHRCDIQGDAGSDYRAKKQGCIAVEMECSASLAVAAFRGIPIIQFFYGADSLDAEQWEIRDLTDYGISYGDKYMAIALECGIAF